MSRFWRNLRQKSNISGEKCQLTINFATSVWAHFGRKKQFYNISFGHSSRKNARLCQFCKLMLASFWNNLTFAGGKTKLYSFDLMWANTHICLKNRASTVALVQICIAFIACHNATKNCIYSSRCYRSIKLFKLQQLDNL